MKSSNKKDVLILYFCKYILVFLLKIINEKSNLTNDSLFYLYEFENLFFLPALT